jgi:hypothetical protein
MCASADRPTMLTLLHAVWPVLLDPGLNSVAAQEDWSRDWTHGWSHD